MKKIDRYQCEICKREYNSEQAALDCESQGPPEEYPIGCIYGDHTPGSFYDGITFAVGSNYHFPRSHMNAGGSWACRDYQKCGDSLGKELCGSGSLSLGKYNCNLNPEQPSFKRMVNWLKEQHIEITVWDGEKPIPYDEWMEKNKK